MNDINDYELIMLYHEKNEDAEEILLKKYNQIVSFVINKNKENLQRLNIDEQGLYSECLMMFSIALNKYNPIIDSSFYTFALTLITRKIKKEILKTNSLKSNYIDNAISLDVVSESNIALKDVIADKNCLDPLERVVLEEKIEDLEKIIKLHLTAFEKDVYHLKEMGLSYTQIAKILGKSYKQIDNTIQRIRNKVKEYILKYDFA